MAAFGGEKSRHLTIRNWRCRKDLEDDYFERIPLKSVPLYPIPVDLIQVLKTNIERYPGISNKCEEWLNSLEVLSKIKYVTDINYLTTFKLLLYLEEYYSEKSPNKYIWTTIHRSKHSLNHFEIEIPKAIHDCVMPNDIVEVTDPRSSEKHNLIVTFLRKKVATVRADARFLIVYRNQSEYMVKFQYSNWPIRTCHYAISLVDKYDLPSILHPLPKPVCNQPIAVSSWFDIKIRRNPEQVQAVQRILGQTAYPSPYLLFGPPGTGKTATIVEAISQILENLNKKVLVCTPSNAAADEITKRLMRNIEEECIYRLNSPSRDRRDIDENILTCSYALLSKKLIKEKKVFIMTLVSCIRLLRTDFFENYFNYIFIDEAGQATQPETLIPFGLKNDCKGYLGRFNAQIVMSGDPKQLGPVVLTKVGQHLLGESMLQRFMDRVKLYQRGGEGKYDPNYITKLVNNYRSHEVILRIPNQMFYDNELVCSGGKEIYTAEGWSELPNKMFPLIFHAVHGLEKRSQHSPSVCNPYEVDVVVKYVSKLMGKMLGGKQVRENDIGIVSPFKFQGEMIKKVLGRKGWRKISVGTVEYFQGQEKSVIIVSTVRSNLFQNDENFHIGFLSNEKRFNVTITRAKSLLIVVGNPEILQIDHCWLNFIKYCQENRACVGDKFTLRELSKDEMKDLLKNKNKQKPIEGELKAEKMEKEADSGDKRNADNVTTLLENLKLFLRFGESSDYRSE